MEWFIIGLVVVGVLGALAKNKEAEEQKENKKKHDLEVAFRRHKAREAILASGDQELIGRLRLMEAGYGDRISNVASANTASPAGASALQTAAAVAGGMVVGNAISGAIAASQLEQALADIGATMDAELASASADIETPDFDFDV